MQHFILGRTNLEISRTGFGALPIQRVSFDEASALLNRALDGGISYIDTARAYTDSEEKIGKAISHRRDEYILATKTGAKDAAGWRRTWRRAFGCSTPTTSTSTSSTTPASCPVPAAGTGCTTPPSKPARPARSASSASPSTPSTGPSRPSTPACTTRCSIPSTTWPPTGRSSW